VDVRSVFLRCCSELTLFKSEERGIFIIAVKRRAIERDEGEEEIGGGEGRREEDCWVREREVEYIW